MLRKITAFLLLTAVAVVLLVPSIRQSIPGRLQAFLAWVQQAGAWGPVWMAAAWIPAAVFMLPGVVLSLGAGFTFGVVTGSIATSLGSVAGSVAAFLVGRTLARGAVERHVAQRPAFRAIDQAVAEQGFKIVFLTRLSPVFPFNLLNYALGLTRVRLRDYVLASWVGMLPGTVMYVYLGSAAKGLSELLTQQRQTSPGETVLFGLGLLAAVVVTVIVTRIARKALAKEVGPAAFDGSAASDAAGGDVHGLHRTHDDVTTSR